MDNNTIRVTYYYLETGSAVVIDGSSQYILRWVNNLLGELFKWNFWEKEVQVYEASCDNGEAVSKD